MNKAKLKTYAPQARKDFIAAVTARANLLGIAQQNGQLEIASGEKTGDLVLIAGQAWPAKVHDQRERLIQRMRKEGFAQTLEAVAYTWFNRFAALRFMEIHDYLGHGHRVLSSREGGLPEILTHATELTGVLPGLKPQQIADMKLAGNQDGELYRLLLVAQCNALSAAMPFLFERIDDETELLLPDNLLRTDSVITQLVGAIPEEDWADIEIIGWLYQFYISEKKDQVIGKVVKSEDIPAATQLFTPNWIVKYMVQNSLGAQWLATYPDSPLKGQMEFYIEPAEQTDEVKAQLAVITPSQLNPEELTLIDPACGSGHILVEAYELFKAIYLERGYRLRDVPQLIIEKNLFGLDIDERAAQLTGFALLMKARADDRRILERGVKLNVMALVDSEGFDAERLAHSVNLVEYGLKPRDLTELKQMFEDATTFGSLIQVPEGLATKLSALKQVSEATLQDLFVAEELKRLGPLVQQAEMLSAQYDAVVANPPYMANKFLNPKLKAFLKGSLSSYSKDLFSAFMFRALSLSSPFGANAYVTPFVWMYLSSYEELRSFILERYSIGSLVKPSYTSFFASAIVSLVTLVIDKRSSGCMGTYFDLGYLGNAESQPGKLKAGIEDSDCPYKYFAKSAGFKSVPGSPIVYSASERVLGLFSSHQALGDRAAHVHGMSTGDNDRFVRRWSEVSKHLCSLRCNSPAEAMQSGAVWFPFNKGGASRRWFGNNELLVNYADEGREMRLSFMEGVTPGYRCDGSAYFFSPAITWSTIASANASFRHLDRGFVICNKGQTLYPKETHQEESMLGMLNCRVTEYLLRLLSPTSGYDLGYVKRVPVVELEGMPRAHVVSLVSLAKCDWDAYERSWDFQSFPLLTASSDPSPSLKSSYVAWITQNRATTAEMKRLEEENNRLFINAYGLQDELTPDVPIEQITLTVNPSYRYGGNLSEAEQWTRFRRDTMQELISYAIGCMMGRYSLDEPGLIYAHAGNVGFDATRYTTFPADADGIIPITDELWFEDDAANRTREFLQAVFSDQWPATESVASDQWPVAREQEVVASDQWLVTSEEEAIASEKLATSHSSLATNMQWLAESLGIKGNETPAETIRRYLASSFFKDHLQTYKKRPIYWLFSSGKQGAFQALVYLHRYHEGTLARMRAEYVVPLTGKMQSRIEMLEKDKDAASSTAARNKIAKQIESLKKKHVELLAYDEKLRHYADMRISLDLDDGVKVNYGKFGDLLAEVKAVTGGKEEA